MYWISRTLLRRPHFSAKYSEKVLDHEGHSWLVWVIEPNCNSGEPYQFFFVLCFGEPFYDLLDAKHEIRITAEPHLGGLNFDPTYGIASAERSVDESNA